jgi:Fungal Zn(2)-Cys(6) binuclear cluster domain/Fungal specific transcription factor domain
MDQRRTLKACDQCKRRKVRCNGQPGCQQCTHAGLACTYTASTSSRRSRKNTVGRGSVIAECRETSASASPSGPGRPIAPAINPSFLLGFLPDYERYVYPMSPVIPADEVREMILHMDDNSELASFVYSVAAVTLNLTRSEPVQQTPETHEHERIATLLSRSLEHRNAMGLGRQPSLTTLVTSVFTQISFIGLRKLDLGFLYLREAISLLYMLHIHSDEAMESLDPRERPRCQRAYWECFIHERFTALTYYRPTCLQPLKALPDHDATLPAAVEVGFNHVIENFRLVDRQFLDFWLGYQSGVTVEWVEQKQRQLEDNEWHREVSLLPLMLQADLIITRHWLRTLTWQIALSNILLSSSAGSLPLLSLSFPLRLSNQLRQFLPTVPHDLVGIHGSGILEKLFEIANTITDVLLHFAQAPGHDTVQRIHDILFLKHFVFSFASFADLRPATLTQKFEMIREKYPEIKEMELLF